MNGFFGRDQYLELLKKRVSAFKDGYRQNIALIGDELVGKTSILLRFLNNLNENKVVSIYIEVRKETLESFAKRFIGVLLYNFLSVGQANLQENLEYLVNKSSGFIPQTTEKIRLILSQVEKKRKENVFSELLCLCETLYQETGKQSLLIFDEFHNLEKIGVRKIYQEWAKLLMVNKHTMFIGTSSMKFLTRNILSKELCLLFGNFEVVNVEPFDIRESELYLCRKLSSVELLDWMRSFLIHFTGGSPFHLNIISEALLASKERGLVNVLCELLLCPTSILHQRFLGMLKTIPESKDSELLVSILCRIANGQNKLKELSHSLHIPRKELDQRINQLMELEFISHNGDFLTLNDRVFSFWLKAVYQKRLNALTYDDKAQFETLRANLEEMLNEFLMQSARPLHERMAELMNMFSDDRILLEKKRLTLTHFREIKRLEFNNPALKEGLICRSSDSIWVMAFKHGEVSESDIAEFSRECRKYRPKLQKKIIVTFSELDQNSRLRALEEKILTLDVNSLNQIFDLFSKPRIISPVLT